MSTKNIKLSNNQKKIYKKIKKVNNSKNRVTKIKKCNINKKKGTVKIKFGNLICNGSFEGSFKSCYNFLSDLENHNNFGNKIDFQ